MEKSTEKSVGSVASGNSINSKLRYPLRSALRSKEGKPPVPDFSGSSVPKRGRVASAVSQSTTVLDLSAKKSVDRTKPPRRLSIPNKGTSNSSVKSVSSSVTSVSEIKAKRSGYAPAPSVLRSVTRRKAEDLSSPTYWLTHIKLAESVAKHSISLGFFKLALHAGCEPLDKMKEELKSYACRNNMDGLEDAMKELSELYNISEESKEKKISETSSVVTVSPNNDSFSTPGNSNITSEITKDDVLQDSAVKETAEEKANITSEITEDDDALAVIGETDKEEKASETVPQGSTRRSLETINVNQEVQESEEGCRPSKDAVPIVQPWNKKLANRKETVTKNNNLPVKTKKSVANSTTVPENKSQKKVERITKPRTKKIQQETKKSIKKPAAKEGEVKSVKQMENKENSVVDAGEEIKV